MELVRWAERRLGELSRELEKASGGDRKSASRTSDPRRRKKAALADIGISKQRAHEYETIALMPQ